MGRRWVSALLLGLLCLLSGALRPGDAQEETTLPLADSLGATTRPLPVSSADWGVSSGVPGPPDLTSEPPGNEIITEPEDPSPPPSSSTAIVPESDSAGSSVTAGPGEVTSKETEPSGTSPATDSHEEASADATQPPAPTLPPSTTISVTAGSTTELPSLPNTLRTTTGAKTQPGTATTPPAATSMSSWMSTVTTNLIITVTTPGASSPTTPHTTRAEVQRGSPVLEVGNENDLSPHSSINNSNPVFVMIVSVFTVMVVMVVVVVGFHRYKKRNNRTEFRRLQDLPMDDMMEDTPLSLYSY